MFTLELNHQQLQHILTKIQTTTQNLTPLMQSIATELAAQTEQNFDEEGRPQWPELSDVTTERRTKNGHWPGKILQVSAGGLAASITTQADENSALVGTNKPYAEMMQFGGERADFPQLWGDVPSRPYLPVDVEGGLQRPAEDTILKLSLDYLEGAVRHGDWNP